MSIWLRLKGTYNCTDSLPIRLDANKEAVTKGELQTPLFYAARNDATKALGVLIKAGCEYKEVRDYRQRTPLYVAAELGKWPTLSLSFTNGLQGIPKPERDLKNCPSSVSV